MSYNATGSYTKKLVSAGGCDSIATLKLQVSPIINASQNVSVCGSSYQLPGGKITTASGTYKTTLKNTAGCDSVITIVLTLNQNPILVVTDPPAVCTPGVADITSAATTGRIFFVPVIYLLDKFKWYWSYILILHK
jgi:hypothetical protein